MPGTREGATITAGSDNDRRKGRRVTLARVPGFDPARLHRMRVSSGLSARDVGDLAGVSEDTIHKWEAGTTSPDPRHAYQLAQALRVRVRDLTTVTDAQIGLTELRVFRGLTLRELAGQTRISPSTLSNIEVGHRRPTPEHAQALADTLGVTTEELMTVWNRVRHRRLETLRARE